MKATDLSRVRVNAERVVADLLAREMPNAPRDHAPADPEAQRHFLRSHSLHLTESMAPKAYAALREAARALGCEEPIELYHSREAAEGSTARLALEGRPIGIELLGACLDVFDDVELVAVLGHEIGHYLVHTSDPAFAWVRGASQRASLKIRRIYAVASELTADRIGLLACRDLDAVLRIEMRGELVNPPAALKLDTRAYLDDCREHAERLLARGRVMFGATHPEHYVRGYAEWLFSETDVYARLTGQGSGRRTLEEVDGLLDRLLGLSSP